MRFFDLYKKKGFGITIDILHSMGNSARLKDLKPKIVSLYDSEYPYNNAIDLLINTSISIFSGSEKGDKTIELTEKGENVADVMKNTHKLLNMDLIEFYKHIKLKGFEEILIILNEQFQISEITQESAGYKDINDSKLNKDARDWIKLEDFKVKLENQKIYKSRYYKLKPFLLKYEIIEITERKPKDIRLTGKGIDFLDRITMVNGILLGIGPNQ